METNMALRLRKTLKIAPGVKVNFSKRGVSASIGPKGFTHTVGKGGLYRNVGIPGTGISSRKKIVGGKKRRKKTATKRTVKRRTTSASVNREPKVPAAVREWIEYTGEQNPSVSIDITLDGTITLYDSHGTLIDDPQLVSIIKRTPMYKEQLPAIKEEHQAEVAERVAEMNADNDEFVRIYRYSPPILTEDYYKEALEELEPQRYERQPYGLMPPTVNEVRSILEEEAKRDVKGSFLKLSTLRKAYVDERLEDRFSAATKEWEYKRAKHDVAESIREKEANEGFLAEYEIVRTSFEKALTGDTDYVEDAAEEWISGIDLPVEIFTQFEYREETHCLMVDLDLPEIEDLPTETATQLANGNLRIKSKTQKQLRQEYAECAFGLAVYVAANLFNVSPSIREVVVSGYTQRRNRAGTITDDYIYSVRLPREKFHGLDYETLDPEAFCMECDNRCNVTQTKVFKAIEPFQ